MKFTTVATIALALVLASLACENTSGLSKQPRATFSQLTCLDNNGDNLISAADASAGRIPDFNADFRRDERDAAFLQGIEIPLDPARDPAMCEGDSNKQPEYLVAHGYFEPADVSCDDGSEPVLLVGIGGGTVNLREKDDAAGVRRVIDLLQRAYDDRDVQTIGVIAGPAIGGAAQVHTSMEEWMTHAVRVYFDRYPCLRAVLVGHSHGAVTADVIAARLEPEYAARFISVVDLDRVEQLYTGDLASRPRQVFVFSIYQTSDPVFPGKPYDAPNAENWDATEVQGPEHGEDGGKDVPVTHTIIDNTPAVHERIESEVLERS